MSLLVLSVLLLAPGGAAPALDAAVRCYDELDYACAEERLAEALASDLTSAQRQLARLHDALLAVAHRDEARARRAVRALLAADPTFEPGAVPPRLRALIEEERPPPPPPPAPLAGLGVLGLPLFGQDGDRWSDGLGVRGSAGVLLAGAWFVEAELAYSDHLGQGLAVEGLTLWIGSLTGGWRGAIGPLRLAGGLGLGAARAAADGAVQDETYWGAVLSAPIDLSYPVWGRFGLGVRVSPAILVRPVDDQAAASYLLPLTAGLRYGD